MHLDLEEAERQWRFLTFSELVVAMNHGVGAEGVLAAQSVLSSDAEVGNDGRVEQLWALKAIGDSHSWMISWWNFGHAILQSPEHAEVYFNLLCAIDPSMLKLTGNKDQDDEIYQDFKKSFPALNIARFTEDDLKSEEAKTSWRDFW